MLIFFPRLADIVVLDLASARSLYSCELPEVRFRGSRGKDNQYLFKVGVVNCIMNIKYAAFLLYLTGTFTLRWRCANLMRFITLQVALFFSNGILYRHAPVCILFVYRYTSIIASFSHIVLANVEQRVRLV